MPWARLDERFPGHRKVRRLSDPAFRLHVSAICWACEYLTNGRISADDLNDISEVRRPQQAADELVRSGRWHLPDHACESDHCFPIDEGWLIHDFLDYNPSREEVESKREKDAERKRVGRTVQSKRSPRGRTSDSNESPSVPAPVVTNVTTPRTGPVGDAGQIVDAYVRGARSIGAPDPDRNLCARVGKQAKAMLASHSPDMLAAAAFSMATKGWHDLAVEIQQMAAASSGTTNKATARTQQGLSVVHNLENEGRKELA